MRKLRGRLGGRRALQSAALAGGAAQQRERDRTCKQ
jgi:hypothetical protein